MMRNSLIEYYYRCFFYELLSSFSLLKLLKNRSSAWTFSNGQMAKRCSVEINKKCFYVRMISEGSCDAED